MSRGQIDNRVLALRCEHYDRHGIEQIVAAGMERLGFVPTGKVLVKPNVVFCGPPEIFGTDAVTHRAVLHAALLALAQAPDVVRLDVGENSGVGFPTRHCYRNAGYYDEIEEVRSRTRVPVDLYCMDEDLRDSVFVGGQVHDQLRISRRLARADTKIYLPKLKCHCVCNMTGAVKLNIGICSDDERSIRHDFLLDDKIVDLLSAGWPDFIVMDAIDVGVGNEGFPHPRKLGLVLMGRNPIAIDLVGARLLGFGLDDVPYLRRAVDRGYGPSSLEQVELDGDLHSIDELDEQAKRIMPYDAEFTAWQDVSAELERMGSPMRLAWGPYRDSDGKRCRTGCIMGLKMFLAGVERYAGTTAFADADPVVFVVGRCDETIDARGEKVFLLGSCAQADVVNAKKVVHLDKCFVTGSDMTISIGHQLGMPSPLLDPKLGLALLGNVAMASLRKWTNLRYAQDVAHFVQNRLVRRI